MATSMRELQTAVDRRLGQMLLAELQKVCRLEQLTVSGKKAELQFRLKSLSSTYFMSGNEDRLRQLKDRLQNPHGAASPQQQSTFRPSPFYADERRLAQLHLPVSKEHRNVASTTFNLCQADVDALLAVNMRVLLYSAAKVSTSSQHLDIAFPQQLEIRVNDNEVKANTRGIKNKSGTTKPVDITPFLKKRSDMLNKVTITYALTDKVYQLYVWMSKRKSIQDLMSEVRRRVIRKDQTLTEIRAKADDPDIITTSTNMKLKDPVSFMRIQTPCRGSSCEHVGCFDLETYLSMQEQAPQWECPLCSKKAPYSSLAVDEYVQEILAKTTSADEQVTIGLDGQWSREKGANTKSANASGANAYQDDDDSDDLIEVSGPRPSLHVKAEAPNTPSSITTPSVTGELPVSSRGQKRQAEVIDLTLSDDEGPVNKRQNFNNNHQRQSSIHSQSNSQSNYGTTTQHPYASRSPLSFPIPFSSNMRYGTGTQSYNNHSSFNPPSTSFSRAIFGMAGIAPSQSRSPEQLQNQQHQSWPNNDQNYQYPGGDV